MFRGTLSHTYAARTQNHWPIPQLLTDDSRPLCPRAATNSRHKGTPTLLVSLHNPMNESPTRRREWSWAPLNFQRGQDNKISTEAAFSPTSPTREDTELEPGEQHAGNPTPGAISSVSLCQHTMERLGSLAIPLSPFPPSQSRGVAYLNLSYHIQDMPCNPNHC